MRRNRRGSAVAFALSLALATPIAEAQKSGGVLIMSHFDNPASMSIHEEATGAVNRPTMGVFNNLVMYRHNVAQNSMASIVPDLATGWPWNEEVTELALPSRPGVRWHDGRAFTAKTSNAPGPPAAQSLGAACALEIGPRRLDQLATWPAKQTIAPTTFEPAIEHRDQRSFASQSSERLDEQAG